MSYRAICPAELHPFLQKYCLECHDTETRKGGLDLEVLPFDLTNQFDEWVKVADRVANGEMPPKKKVRPAATDLSTFTNSLSASLRAFDLAQFRAEGRATKRRLNRYEYEETLRDLLSLPYLEVKNFLPEDTLSHGFN